MLSLEREIDALRPALGDARAGALIARERREVFSLHPELRLAAWAGAMLLASAAGIVLKERLSLLMIPAAAACYAWVWWHRSGATIADDYVLLLGGLLVSAEVVQLHRPRPFLILAIVHGLGAYVYGSRILLSLSIAGLAAAMGIERGRAFEWNAALAPRAFLTAAMLIAWRELHRRLASQPFLRVFEYFAMNLTLWGSLTLLTENGTFVLGCLLTIALAAAAMGWGFLQRSEPFVLIALVYGVIAAEALVVHYVDDAAAPWIILISTTLAIAVLIAIDRGFRARRG